MDPLQLTFCNIESLTSNKMHLISPVTVRCKKKTGTVGIKLTHFYNFLIVKPSYEK
jgi:hypothetical protein